MVIKINYTSSDIYVSTNVSPIYVVVNYSGVGGTTNAVWGAITGTLSDQTDLQTALDAKFDDPTGTIAQYLRGDGSLATFPAIPGGTVTSVGLTMPSAFNVANSPVTSAGTLAVTGAGLATQYIRGDGQLATFPSTASGGSSVNYYLNGSVNASVGGYKQLANTATIGGGTDFTLVGNGLIAQFLTDSGNPNRVEIPGGAWNFEMYFQVSSAGGNQKFYVELLKYNGTTFTSIASSSAVPEEITGGTSIDLYLTSLAVPTTALLVTDRLAIRVYIVDNAAGRTVTLHTEDNTLCEIITTFAGGIAALNGLSANTQYLATGTSGTDFNISSLTDTHTFNLPTASATNRGALSSADWSTFNAKVPSTRTLTINGTAYDLSADRSWTVSGTNIYSTDGTLTGDRTVTANGNSLTILGGKETFTGYQRALWLKTSTNIKNSIELILENTFTTTGRTYEISSQSDGSFNIGDRTSSNLRLKIFGSYFQFHSTGTNANLLGSVAGINALWFNQDAATASTSNYTLCNAGGLTLLNAPTGGSIYFRIGNVDKALLTSAGRLLLGTTSESTFLLDVNGTARVSGNVLVEKNQNAVTDIIVSNTTNGTGAYSRLRAISDSAREAQLFVTSSTWTDYGALGASTAGLYTNASGGFAIYPDLNGAVKIITGSGGTNSVKFTLTAAGRLLLGTTSESTFLLDVNGTARVSDTFTAGTNTFTNKLNAQFGTFGIQSYAINNGFMSDNMYYNSSASSWTRIATGFGMGFQFVGGQVLFHGVASGTGNFTQNVKFKFDHEGAFAIGNNLTGTLADYTGATALFTKNGRLLLGTTTETTDILLVAGTARVNTAGGTTSQLLYLKNSTQNSTTASTQLVMFRDGASGIAYGGIVRFNQKAYTSPSSASFTQLDISMSDGATESADTTPLSIRGTGIGINNTSPDASAMLDVASTTKGFLPPRVTTTQKTSIASPVAGLQVYDTTLNSISVYDGATWRNDTDTVTTNRQAASYTLALTDRGKLVEMNVATANNLTVPLNSVIAFPIGSKIDIAQYGAGQTTVVATGGVTIRSAGGALKLALQYSGASLVKIGTDEWYLFGDITV